MTEQTTTAPALETPASHEIVTVLAANLREYCSACGKYSADETLDVLVELAGKFLAADTDDEARVARLAELLDEDDWTLGVGDHWTVADFDAEHMRLAWRKLAAELVQEAADELDRGVEFFTLEREALAWR